ncbi:cupin domain-containing protein [Sphingobium lactosutens]|uniref:cupin domain-containing protein n=1 Tax=Sphingobium lactosutens TaxID=522773 RepID=UPI0015C0693B|nr:cupin domain-containing protein [Sphingobium lactosutens]
MRRIVTRVDETGKSRVTSDGSPPRERVLCHTPGFVSSPIWMAVGATTAEQRSDALLERTSLLAPPGGATFLVVTFPPDSVMGSADFDPVAAGQEHLEAAPGIADTFEPQSPGMHRTPTLDYVTVIAGRIVLELDEGQCVTLVAGDTVVQHGVRHAWRNPGHTPATLSFVMLTHQPD